MDILIMFQELFKLLDLQVILVLVVSTSVGIVIGALPGLTATMGIALLTGLTYKIPTSLAIPVLIGIYVGAIYGGSISAVLINIPGTGASAATALDGFPLSRQGKAAKALYLTRMASFIGTIFGMIALITVAPLISRFAERYFASPEFFLLAIFGILICGTLTAMDKPIKGWIAGLMGVMISFVGIDQIHGFPRFTFGNPNLLSGIGFIPAMIGVFGIPQILSTLKEPNPKLVLAEVENTGKGGLMDAFSELTNNWINILRSGLIGVGIGSIPGCGEDIASWMAYDRAKKASKKPKLFGKGSYEGLIASEAGNNSCIGGAIIPLLTLAVPGSPPAAVLLGALYLHGIRPGPMLPLENPTFLHEMAATILLASFALLICGILLSRAMVTTLKVKPAILMPIVGALSVIGSYAINISLFDLQTMVIFGLIGYFLIEMGYPPAPLILGAILGPLADTNFRRTLLGSGGSIAPFFTRPVSILFVILILVTILSQFPFWDRLWRKNKELSS